MLRIGWQHERGLSAGTVRETAENRKNARGGEALRVNGTANIGIASPGLVASDQQVWYPSLQHVAGKTPSSPPFREKMNDAPTASSNSYHHIYFGGNTSKLETI